MIAPVREPQRRSLGPPRGLAMARRAVAAVLFGRHDDQLPPPPAVSAWLAWAFVAGIVAVAISYFAWASWWTVERY